MWVPAIPVSGEPAGPRKEGTRSSHTTKCRREGWPSPTKRNDRFISDFLLSTTLALDIPKLLGVWPGPTERLKKTALAPPQSLV